MSRIGKKPITIPAGAEATLNANVLTVKGPKGTLNFTHRREVSVAIADGIVTVDKVGVTKLAQALWGTTAKIIANMLEGVTTGFTKALELNGVGFRMNIQGKKLVMALGFSHPVEMTIPEGLEAKIENNVLTISGIDRQAVGEFAAVIKKLKPVEPYKGKGFRYVGEQVRRKEGKRATS
jgi:large subunit ribosomal protein L6